MWWAIGFAVILLGGCMVVPLIGFLLPIRFTGRHYLAKQLRMQGVDTRKIPDACMQEMADIAISQHRIVGEMTNKEWRTQVPQALEHQAVVIAEIFENVPMVGVMSDYASQFREVLNRHGVRVPPAEKSN
jgi:hypothetical protein